MTMPTPKTVNTYDANEIELRYQVVTPDTLLRIERNTKGNQLPGSRFTATLAEARKERWLDSMHGTMEWSAEIAPEHAPAYFTDEVSWRKGKPVVYEPREWLK